MTKLPPIPVTDAEAIAFALDYLQAFEIRDFLNEWRQGKCLKPWLEALIYASEDFDEDEDENDF